MKKRVLSLILAIAMLMSLLPTLSFAAETPTEFSVDLAALITTFPDERLVPKQTARWYIFAGDDVHGANWKIITDKSESTVLSGTTKTAAQHFTSYLPISVSNDYATNGWDTLAFEITAPTAGTYTVAVIGRSTSSDVIFTASVNDTDIGSWTLNATKTGVKAGQQVTCASTVPVALKQGANTVKIKQAQGQNGYFGFEFIPTGELDKVELSYGNEYILVGDVSGEKLMLSATDTNGGSLNLEENATIVYESLNESIATVTNEGVVMPHSEGNVTINVTVTVGNITKEGSIELEVKSFEHTAEFDPAAQIGIEEEYTLSARALLSNGTSAPEDSVTFRFESDNTDVLKVDGNKIIGVSEGSANVTAYVTFNKIEKSVTKEIAVTPLTPFTIDFGKFTSALSELKQQTNVTTRYYVENDDPLYGEDWKILTSPEKSSVMNSASEIKLQYYTTAENANYINIIASTADIEAGNNILAVEFDVPQSGIYNLSSIVYSGSDGGWSEIFVDDISLGKHEQNYDKNAGDKAGKQTIPYDMGLYLEEGKHSLKVESTAFEGKTRAVNGFYGFTFTPSGELSEATLSCDKSYILLADPNGEKLKVSATYETETAVNVSRDAKVTYESSDETVATVTADGIVMPKSEDEVTITAYVTVGEVTKECSLKLEIIDLTYTEVSFELPEEIQLNDKYKLSATAMFDNGSAADAADVTCRFESDNAAVAEITADNSLVGKMLGTANITAYVTFNGETKSITKQIEVVPISSFTLDFNKVTSDMSKLDKATGGFTTHAIKVGNEFYGSNWKFLTDVENSKIFGNNPDKALKLANYGGNYINITKTQADLEAGYDTLAIEFTSPTSGIFDVSSEMYFGASGGWSEIYIDGKYVGKFDSNKEANGGATTRNPARYQNAISIDKGEHLLTIKSYVHNGVDEVTNGFYTFKFNSAGSLEKVDLTHDRAFLILDDAQGDKLTLSAEYSSGSAVDLVNDATVIYESSDDNIATVTADGTVIPKSSGDVVITATVTVGGVSKSDSCTITVKDLKYTYAEIDLVHELFYVGGKTEISATAFLSDGTPIDARDVTCSFESGNTAIATVEDNVLSTIAEGEAEITAHVTFNGVTHMATKTIRVVPVALSGIEVKTEDAVVSALDLDGSRIIVTGRNNDGSEGSLEGATFTYESLTPDTISVRVDGNDGYVIALSRGEARIKVSADISGLKFSAEADVISSSQKTEPTIYTYKMREAALENIKKYAWAKSLQKTAIKNADKWVENLDALYDSILYEGIPRSFIPMLINDPDEYKCVYCGLDLREKYSPYNWGVNPIARRFKVRCPDCKRTFPSNDFGKFYELGLDQKRQFNRLRALDAHRAMLLEQGKTLPEGEISEERRNAIATGDLLTDFELDYYGYGMGYLENTAYKEVGTTLGVPAEEVSRWAVDDGFGWDTRKKTTGEVAYPIKKMFIACYHHQLYGSNSGGEDILTTAIDDLRDAYLYTGDIKYGRAGAILIDRIADVYPSFDLNLYPSCQNSHGGKKTGKIIGSIWECSLSEHFVRAYDAFYPAMDDPQVIKYLSEKAAQFGLENPKTNGNLIRENSENGIVRETFKGAKSVRIAGNYGMHQSSVSLAAIALDSFPETAEMFDWVGNREGRTRTPENKPLMEFGIPHRPYLTLIGGGMLPKYVNDVDRDGFGYEIGAGYNQNWVTDSITIADQIYRYGKYEGLNLFDNAKYRKMQESIIKMTMAGGYTLQLGDTTRTADPRQLTSALAAKYAFYNLRDPKYAQIIYYLAKGDVSQTYLDIFQENIDEFQQDILDVVEEYGEYELGSRNLTGFGLVVLSGGEKIAGANGADFRRDTWLWHGNSTQAHGHNDTLQMGIDAYGHNFTPDLGYPAATSNDPNRIQWVSNTLSHNTVVVDGNAQKGRTNGDPLHYEGDGLVKLIDVEDADVYDETDIYRRTLVSVDASPEVAYTVDFFRVRGGKEHIYSFHTQSADGVTVDGLNLVPQVDENGNYIGSYAGADVPWGEDPNTDVTTSYVTKYPAGYTWLKHVRRATPESGEFTVNFKQTDFKKLIKDSKDLNLKFTALNDWQPSSVGIAVGEPPNRTENKVIPYLDYMLIHRTGKNLDTLFTSVIQPYKGEEYIAESKSVALESSGGEGKKDTSKAVRITLKSGRSDYIIYATNPDVTYTVIDEVNGNPVNFSFRGFVGVYSVDENGNNIYSYINDGDLIGNLTATPRLTGKVSSFTEELTSENFISVAMDKALTAEEIENLAGRYIYIDNDTDQNGSYEILSASGEDRNLTLNIGDVSVIKGYKSVADLNAGFTYNIATDQDFTIPLSATDDASPIIAEQGKATATAESSIALSIKAESPLDEELTYIGTIMPRGASIDSETGIITWKPTSSQIGENGFLITVRDESGRESSISFEITVYGSTTGGSGNAGTPAPSTPSTPTIPPTQSDEKDNTAGSTDNVGDGVPNVPQASGNARFIDLGNHAWAEDAINSLADEGIIKGTSENTFSPAANITRADFAVLLVRAFKLASENSENFADVSSSDYFAKELAVARNTGLVNGVGDNKFAPRNNITRQDMMVIVYRALAGMSKLNVGDGVLDVPQASDFDTVSDYAKEAVSALVNAKLINGKNGLIDPTANTTRAEVAVLIKRILDFAK